MDYSKEAKEAYKISLLTSYSNESIFALDMTQEAPQGNGTVFDLEQVHHDSGEKSINWFSRAGRAVLGLSLLGGAGFSIKNGVEWIMASGPNKENVLAVVLGATLVVAAGVGSLLVAKSGQAPK